jgi:hypothetical protein
VTPPYLDAEHDRPTSPMNRQLVLPPQDAPPALPHNGSPTALQALGDVVEHVRENGIGAFLGGSK